MSTTSQARQRILTLLDDNSFVEIGAMITARATDFNLKQTETPSDGVITGYGVIEGNLVYVFSQDQTVLNGSIGEMHARKIAKVYDLAMKVGAPVIGFIDSAGIRLQESTDALHALGELYQKQIKASGMIPQITAIFGPCGGGLAVFSALSDFVFMETSKGKLFVNAPNTLDKNRTEVLDTSKADFQYGKTGILDGIGSETDILTNIRELITILPACHDDDASFSECEDDLNRLCDNLELFAGDSELLAITLSDNQFFFPVKQGFAKEMTCGFIRLNGATVGLVANKTESLNESGEVVETFYPGLTANGCEKAAEFIGFCDAFQIPILSITNTKGFEPTIENEFRIAKASAKLANAFSSATVPKVNLITKQAMGTAYVLMNSQGLGSDFTLSWPETEVAAMEADLAAKILCQGQGLEAIEACKLELLKMQNSEQGAARRGFVDQIVPIKETRKYVIASFEMLFTKREERPNKKHGTL